MRKNYLLIIMFALLAVSQMAAQGGREVGVHVPQPI